MVLSQLSGLLDPVTLSKSGLVEFLSFTRRQIARALRSIQENLIAVEGTQSARDRLTRAPEAIRQASPALFPAFFEAPKRSRLTFRSSSSPRCSFVSFTSLQRSRKRNPPGPAPVIITEKIDLSLSLLSSLYDVLDALPNMIGQYIE